MPTPHARPRRAVPGARSSALIAVVALLTGLLVALAGPASADPTPPPNPTDAQIGAAQAGKTQLATQVGALTAQLSQLQVQVEQLQAAAELAEQKYALAAQQLQEAKDAATAAQQGVAAAQVAVQQARSAFNAAVLANYKQGEVQGGAGALLASPNPDAVLQSSAFQSYVTAHQADGIGQLDRAKVAKANADAAARTAVANQTTATAAAQQAYTDARSSEAAAQQQQQSLAAQTTAVQAQLDTAQATLLGLQDQRAAYDAWKAEQARIAAAQAAAAQAALIAQQQAAAAAAAKAAAGHSGGSGGGSGASSGGGGGGGSAPSGNPAGGSWTAARGQDAVNRAMAYLNERYSFAAGNYNGPTWGVCGSDDNGWNDCHVFGFDCSGLVLYAWAPYIHMAHYAATQYTQAGHYHPGLGNLMPGDLLFYGRPNQGDIHHVAMYIGGGNVIQAPQSGDVVKITPVNRMGSDYYGATRPLT